MMTGEELARLKRCVWPADSVRPVRIYAVLDGARDPSIHDLIARSYREKSCLFAGNLDIELERAAPFVLELQPKDSITDEILLRGWKDDWGILVRTESSFRNLRRHLRTFLRVQTEDGRFLLFRYHDPRVLNAYLPTCNVEELSYVFGTEIVAIFSFASTAGTTQRYSHVDGELRTVAQP